MYSGKILLIPFIALYTIHNAHGSLLLVHGPHISSDAALERCSLNFEKLFTNGLEYAFDYIVDFKNNRGNWLTFDDAPHYYDR